MGIIIKTKACVKQQNIFWSDEDKRLYLHEKASSWAVIQNMQWFIKRNENFSVVDGEGAFGEGDDTPCPPKGGT